MSIALNSRILNEYKARLASGESQLTRYEQTELLRELEDLLTRFKPDASSYNRDALASNRASLLSLLDKIKEPELMTRGKVSARKVAARLGIPERTFRSYMSGRTKIDFIVIWALQSLAD